MIRVIVFDCIALVRQYYSMNTERHTKRGRQKQDMHKTKTGRLRDKTVTAQCLQAFMFVSKL